MKKYLFPALALSLSNYTLADTQQQQAEIDRHLNDQRIQTEVASPEPQFKSAKTVRKAEPSKTTENRISMSKEELVQHPDLVIRALQPALVQGNADNVDLLFPIYQKIPAQFHDPIMTKWSLAVLARKNDNYREAIRLYREILAEHSEILPVRLQLAISLFENNELEASEDQFKKLRSEKLVPQIADIIEQYLAAISRKDRWTFSGGLTYLNDPNINNAPKKNRTKLGTGELSSPSPEKGEGFGFNANIGKKWSWGNGFFNELRLDTNGKYYWNNKKYNEASFRGSFGIGFQNAKASIVLLPFIEQQLYAGGSNRSETLKRFSKTSGIGLEASYWLSPKWKLNANYEYGEQRYMSRKHLNGNQHFISTGLLYLANSKQYWFTNLNYNRTSTRDESDSYFRRGINFGWGQEWDKGFSTRISVGLAQKSYKGVTPFFGRQKNRELTTQFSIWHRAIHYWGITPRLTYNFTKVKSNHVLTTYDKHRIFVDFSKEF